MNRTMDKSKATVEGYLYDVRSFMTYIYIFGGISIVIGFILSLLGESKLYAKICLISGGGLLFVLPIFIKNYKVNGRIIFCKEKIDLIYDDGKGESYDLSNMEDLVIDYSNYWFQSKVSMASFSGFDIKDGTENFVSFKYNGEQVNIMFQVRNRQFFRDVYDLWKHRDSPLIKLIHNNKSPVVKWTNKKSNNEKN